MQRALRSGSAYVLAGRLAALCDADEVRCQAEARVFWKFAGYQHGVHDDGQLARNRDRSALEPEPLAELQPPFVQVALGSATHQQYGRGFVEQA